MRQIQLTLLFAAIMLFMGCEKPVNNTLPEPSIAVTYKSIAGAWELTEWNNEPLIEGTYLYVAFDSKEHRFEMWDNIGSMYTQHKSGSYTISQNDEGEYILTGQYDNGVGDWANEYGVTLLQGGEEMTWRNGEELMLFSHIDSVPDLN